MPGMSAIAYTVTAILPDASWAERYVAWLEDGHIDQVIKGGAHSAMIVRLDADPPVPGDPATARRVEVRYIFSTREMYDRYVSEFAPALRAEGQKLFGPETGVRFERRTGTVV